MRNGRKIEKRTRKRKIERVRDSNQANSKRANLQPTSQDKFKSQTILEAKENEYNNLFWNLRI